MAERVLRSNAAGALSGSVHIAARPWSRESKLGASYNLQPNNPLSSDKPHLLKVPQSLQKAPLSREQGLRYKLVSQWGTLQNQTRHLIQSFINRPHPQFPPKEPLPSATLGRFLNGNLSRSASHSLPQLWAHWAGFAGLHCVTWQGVSDTAPLTTPYTLLPPWVLISRLPGALLPIKPLVSLSKKWPLRS